MAQLFAAFGIQWQLLLAQAVNFGILLVALSYLLYKPVMKIIDERRALVTQGVEDAKRAEEKLAAADGVAAERVSTAESEAAAVVAQARSEAAAQKTQIVKEAEQRAASIAEDADLRAKETAAKALRESEKEIARLAVLAAEKIMRTKA